VFLGVVFIGLGGGVGPRAASAQVSVGLRLGVVGTTRLVRDSIVEVIDIRPNLAPAVGFSVESVLDGPYSVGAAITLSRSGLESRSISGTTQIATLTLWQPTVSLRRAIVPWLSAEARLGAIIFAPSKREGTLFRDGAPVEATLGLGLRADRPLGGHLAGGVAVLYDAHRFTTTALQTVGFTGRTVVHRVAVMLDIRMARGRP
jgi:hypothetical protein